MWLVVQTKDKVGPPVQPIPNISVIVKVTGGDNLLRLSSRIPEDHLLRWLHPQTYDFRGYGPSFRGLGMGGHGQGESSFWFIACFLE